MKIRKATANDAERLYDIHMAALREICSKSYTNDEIEAICKGKTPEGYLERIDNINVAEQGGEVVGWCHAGEGCIWGLFVDPSYINMGVGRMLVSQILKGIQNDDGEIAVEATLNSVGFYQKMGFKETGIGFTERGGCKISIKYMMHTINPS
jgi:ribosomal protein S18 acetylase RimI-like enzyme